MSQNKLSLLIWQNSILAGPSLRRKRNDAWTLGSRVPLPPPGGVCPFPPTPIKNTVQPGSSTFPTWRDDPKPTHLGSKPNAPSPNADRAEPTPVGDLQSDGVDVRSLSEDVTNT